MPADTDLMREEHQKRADDGAVYQDLRDWQRIHAGESPRGPLLAHAMAAGFALLDRAMSRGDVIQAAQDAYEEQMTEAEEAEEGAAEWDEMAERPTD